MRESLRRLASDDSESMVRKVGSKRRVRIELLDGEHINIDLDRKAKGEELLDKVCENIDLQEKDYFGLLHTQRGDARVWVDLGRRLSKTFRNEPWDVRLAVKFYPSEPSELRDDGTRYHLALAVRADLMEGRLSCSAITSALLASYVLQAEAGDFVTEGAAAAALTAYNAAPLALLTPHFVTQVEELHRKHRGLSPAEAELQFLENAKKLPQYGVALHAVKDYGGADIALGVSAAGVAVWRDGVVMNRFPWPKIIKISFAKRSFTLKLRASEFDHFQTNLVFALASSRQAKKLWRCAVDHHVFFRRAQPVVVNQWGIVRWVGARRTSCRRTLRQLRDLHCDLLPTSVVGVAAS